VESNNDGKIKTYYPKKMERLRGGEFRSDGVCKRGTRVGNEEALSNYVQSECDLRILYHAFVKTNTKCKLSGEGKIPVKKDIIKI
jgi:hypothetical protein